MRTILACLLLTVVGCTGPGTYMPSGDDGTGDDDDVAPGIDADVLGEDPADAAPEVPTGRVTEGLEGKWDFKEGLGATIHDTSTVGTPMDLTVAQPGLTTWVTGGLRIDASTILRSNAPATKIIDACKLSNEITVEAWVTPKSLTTLNPARIAGVSVDTGTRNFSLIQQNADYEFRLRTGVTDLNGTPATVAPAAVTIAPQHVVATRNPLGLVRIYLDGVEVAQLQGSDTFALWDNSYEFAIANELTVDRPWLGTVHLVAVYCRMLTAEEVLRNFGEGY